MSEPCFQAGTFGFQKGGVGTASGTVIVGQGAMATYPYEPTIFGNYNEGRTHSGRQFCYALFEGKHRWTLHWEDAMPATREILGSFFNTRATFFFNPNVGAAQWYECRCVNPDYSPILTFVDRWTFTVNIEET